MSYTPTQWQTGDTITAEKLNNMESGIENVNEPFIVTLTPTAADFSGTMDKTVGEIYEAYLAGRQIRFRIIVGGSKMEVECTARGDNGVDTYPSFNAFIITEINNVLILAGTGTTSDPDKASYLTHIYTLTPAT